MKALKKLLFVLALVPLWAFAAEGGAHLDHAPNLSGDPARLQNGARLFVNYCLNCHSASFVRYNRLTDLGLSEQQIRDNLMFTAEKIGDPMRVAARPKDQQEWFGVAPPDLSLVARARASAEGSGADWLYTYLRSFYRDEARTTGWNNTLFANVAMPHVLVGLQGEMVLNAQTYKLDLDQAGQLSVSDYDREVADLVGFLVWASEPVAPWRKQVGYGVLAFLLILLGFAYALKKEFWKDVPKN